MRTARTIVLLSLSILAVAAFAAAPASATGGVAAEHPFGGSACEPFYCVFQVDGESHLARLDTGAIVSTCEDEYIVELNSRADGDITWRGSAHGAPGCYVRECDSVLDPWTISSSEEIAAGQVEFLTHVCIRNIITGVESTCLIDIIVTQAFGGAYHFDAATQCPNMGLRLELEAETEPSDGITIHHL